MRTSASSTRRFWRATGGATAVEVALIVPFLMLAAGGVAELGAYFQQVGAVEKGLRSAAMYAARSELPLSSSTQTTIGKIASTGQPSGGSNLAAGWSDSSAKLDIAVSDVTTGGVTVSVIKLTATLPYSPVVPIIDELIGLHSLTISATQEQVHIGS